MDCFFSGKETEFKIGFKMSTPRIFDYLKDNNNNLNTNLCSSLEELNNVDVNRCHA